MKRFQWVKVKRELPDKLFSKVSLKEGGLFFKTAILVLSLWRKLKHWFHHNKQFMKISAFGLLVSNIPNSPLGFFKKHSRLLMNLLKVSRQVSIRLLQLLLPKNSLIKLIMPTGVHLFSLFASSTQSLLKERNLVLLVGVFPTNITTLT